MQRRAGLLSVRNKVVRPGADLIRTWAADNDALSAAIYIWDAPSPLWFWDIGEYPYSMVPEKYSVRAYYPISVGGGGLAWHKIFSNGAARDAELMACALRMQAGELVLVTVTSRVPQRRLTDRLESSNAIRSWVQKFGATLR